ncbi:WD40/YVTN/BNR-like repeat-containing protein [Thauera sinica]|uniref:WD40/YVTN/BNR-like repeat-containing protein n=1 Tax=Thauera sinica TaxID=2665146 RepID=A0ABW1AY97_9RHOO|nr:YCF48-related protein [Thauera sp. K11]ATE61229.1 glycosyl hydrolase [Thauera sp. K11]
MNRTNDRYELAQLRMACNPAALAMRASPARRVTPGRLAAAVLPATVIAGLLYAGLFIKPAPSGQAVPLPVLERRDAFFGIDMPASGVVWAAGSRGKIVRSDDGGRTWARQAAPTAEHLQDIAAWDAQRAVAVGNRGVLLRTEDGGRHWSNVAVPLSAVDNKLLRVRTTADGRAFAVGEMGALLGSRDHGRNWQRLMPEQDVGLNGVAVVGDRVWVAGERGLILHSADGGATWVRQPVPVARSLTAVAFRDARRGVAVGLNGTILTTENGGLDWNDRSIRDTPHLYDVAHDGEGWYAVGERDLLLQADAEAGAWRASRATGTSLAWHSEIAIRDGRRLYAGPGPSLAAQAAAGIPPANDGKGPQQ